MQGGGAAAGIGGSGGPGLQWGGVENDPNFKTAKLSDKLKEADIERRLESEAIAAREEAVQRAREERARKVALLTQIPDDVKAGTVDDFMYKEGVKDILEKLDYDLIGLKPVKQRVREIASLLVVDKMRLKLGLETSVPSLHMGFTGAAGRDLAPFSDPSRKPLGPFLQARPAPARRRSRCAWARSCSGWATAARGTWSSRRATTWWGSTWATRRPRPGRRSGGRGHVHDTSETCRVGAKDQGDGQKGDGRHAAP